MQASVDSAYTENPIKPSNQAFADCLDLKGSVRQDFIDSLVVFDPETDEDDEFFSASYDWYSSGSGPVVE